MKKIILLLCILLCVNTFHSFASKTDSLTIINTKELTTAEIIDSLVVNKDLDFIADRAIPVRMKARNITGSYGLTIKGDTVNCHLPYFGRVHSAPIGSNDNSIKATNAAIENYTVTEIKSGTKYIKFSFKSENHTSKWEVTIQVFDNGKATINCTNPHTDRINFLANLKNGLK